jgi:hypothetical protein
LIQLLFALLLGDADVLHARRQQSDPVVLVRLVVRRKSELVCVQLFFQIISGLP